MPSWVGGVGGYMLALPGGGYRSGGYILLLRRRGYDKLGGDIKPQIDGNSHLSAHVPSARLCEPWTWTSSTPSGTEPHHLGPS